MGEPVDAASAGEPTEGWRVKLAEGFVRNPVEAHLVLELDRVPLL